MSPNANAFNNWTQFPSRFGQTIFDAEEPRSSDEAARSPQCPDGLQRTLGLLLAGTGLALADLLAERLAILLRGR